MKGFTDRDPIKVGLVVIAVATVLIAGVFLFNNGLFHPTFPVTARFTENAGLASGDQVLVAGVKVGSVGAITQRGNAVYATLDLYEGTKLPANSSASITVQTLLGLVGVDLNAGTDWSHLLASGSKIDRTSIPVEYYQLQNVAGQDLAQTNTAALNQLIRSLADITQGKQVQVRQIIDGLSTFTATINAHSAQLASLIDSATSLSGAFTQREDQLSSSLQNLDTVVAGLAANNQAVGSLIDGIDQAATQTSKLVGPNQRQLDSLLANLHTVLQVVQSHQLDLAQGVSYLEKAVQGFASTSYSGPGGSPNPSWTNTYTNLTGTVGIYGVIGPCGLVDEGLNKALGPDPLACNQQTGPIPQYMATPVPGGQKAQAQPPTSSGYASASGSQSGAPAAVSGSSASALPGLFSVLLGGGS